MGERQVTREELESSVKWVRDAKASRDPSYGRALWLDGDAVNHLLAAAEAVLRIERTDGEGIAHARSLVHRADERAEAWQGGFMSGWMACERHILARLGALAPKEDP